MLLNFGMSLFKRSRRHRLFAEIAIEFSRNVDQIAYKSAGINDDNHRHIVG